MNPDLRTHESGFANTTLKDLVCGFDLDICFQITRSWIRFVGKKSKKVPFVLIREDSSTNPATKLYTNKEALLE
jgi:hypothetical protein